MTRSICPTCRLSPVGSDPKYPTAGINASEYTLSVITSARSEAIDVPLSLVNNEGSELSGTNTMGQAFAVTLTFKATQIEAKATVTDWVNGGTASGDIQ